MTQILPALLGADPLALGEAIDALADTRADLLHLDVMDGAFVPEISYGTRTIAAVRRRTTLQLDVHLQVERPETYLDALIEARTDLVTVHVETTPHISRLLRTVTQAGLQAGVALNPGTPLAQVEEVLEQVVQVTVMTSSPGTSDFMPHVLDKIRRLRTLLDSRGLNHLAIAADGGVTVARAGALRAAGADRLIAGSAVFQATGGVAAGIEALREAAQ
ncbi:ribulose-phosphate 3-epimerase [Streptomyces clavuligerus]|uniref:Ribulose-phosphate 3-epimerase n=1 Tax=Streptomyces clavuligerus TaxID=1901 RepID=B5GMF6_STRCL|nr:ribulose-phosphate 3-epimerase [Streptomyces clavuligerus]ANW22371.1 ribulose phosphate epimerase [Streptomyces clavuligerus]AXU17275.1 ribulose-phosphate 3-epimerase [Streptomyces clavuligerus]EDY47502.1 ribulose-phosphate 3-epimerase [Streptomyces clavuligerus]EFG04462.1 Ribulose-phosphate 3-epimerase [Streptomyces clavuligerus]MBY6307080.1 ribulose-phosphate 3-epimerase [Streptomyces clavuligerus]